MFDPGYPFRLYECPQHEDRNCCAVVASSVLFDVTFNQAQRTIATLGRTNRRGTSYSRIVIPMLTWHNCSLTDVSAERFTTRMLHKRFADGKYWVQFRDHCAALVDGVLVDVEAQWKGRRVAHVWRFPKEPSQHKLFGDVA